MQRRILVVVALLGAIAGIALLLALLSRERPEPQTTTIERPVEVLPPEPETELRAERRHGTLQGRVLNGNTDEPIERAKVIALTPYLEQSKDDDAPLWNQMIEKKHVYTDREGKFRLEELPPDYWNLWVEKPGYAFTTVPRARFDQTHVIKLYPACSIHGKVVYGDDTPAAGIRIEYTPQGTHSEVFSNYRLKLYYIETDANGFFEYTDLPPGKFTVEVYPPDHLPAPWKFEPPLKPGENRDLGTHRLDRGFGMTVKVLWRDTGEPVEGIEVVVRPVGDPMPRTRTGRRILTNQDGVARFAGLGGQVLDEPTFMVVANVPGVGPVMPDEQRLFRPDEEVTIYLRKAGVIRGKVLRPSGDPLETFWVELAPKGFQTRQLRVRGENGRFEIFQVPEGSYLVHIRYGNLVDQAVDATVVGGKEADVGTVTLQQGAEVRGIVRTANGSELEGLVRVEMARKVRNALLDRDEWETVGRSYCRKDGSYAIKGLLPGAYHIQAQPEDGSATTKPIPLELPPGVGSLQQDLVVYGTGHLDLLFVDQVEGSERRVVPAPTWLVPRDGGEEVRWYANGTPLRPGHYTVWIELGDGDGSGGANSVSQRYKFREVEIQEGATAGPIEVRLFEIRNGG